MFVIPCIPELIRLYALLRTVAWVDELRLPIPRSAILTYALMSCWKPVSFALADVVTIWPGGDIRADVGVLDACDQLLLQFAPVKRSAKAPERKLCMAVGVIKLAGELDGDVPKAV